MSIQQTQTAEERFWSRVEKNGPVIRAELGPCWPWTGGHMGDGRGHLRWNGRWEYAPRVAYELTYGPITEGKGALHHCDYPPCCRPSHLYAGDQLDNIRDRCARGRTARGDRAGARRHPEALRRGETHHNYGRGPVAILNRDAVEVIRAASPEVTADIDAMALRYGVTRKTVQRVVQHLTWRDLP
jgi:hypothetical protein